jgi:hypothetical protein
MFLCMAYLSTQTASIQAITRTLSSAMLSHLDEVAARAGALLFPGGVPPGVDLRVTCIALITLLQGDADELAQIDREVARERHEDDRARARRDLAVGALRDDLMITRDVTGGAYGLELMESTGLGGRIPTQTDALLVYARNVVEKLPSLALNPSASSFVQIDIGAAFNVLTGRTEELDAALTGVATDLRETQMVQSQRSQVEERWRRHYAVVADIIEGLLRLAGFDHLADRVRPTRRRRAGLTEPDDGVGDGLEPQPPAGDVSGGDLSPAGPGPVAAGTARRSE